MRLRVGADELNILVRGTLIRPTRDPNWAALYMVLLVAPMSPFATTTLKCNDISLPSATSLSRTALPKMSLSLQIRGGPYASTTAGMGGLPTIVPDIPICAAFLVLYIAFAVHQENPRIDKDISGNSESDIALSIGPGYAQDKGGDSCHAEPE